MMKNQFLSLESFVNKTYWWGFKWVFIHEESYPLYGRNPHIGDSPIKNEAFPYGQNQSSR